MTKRRTIALAIILPIAVASVLAFVPTVAVVAIPVHFQYFYCDASGRAVPASAQGAQTCRDLEVSDPPSDNGLGSLTYCLFDQGGLFLSGTYYPVAESRVSEGGFCRGSQ